MYLVYVDESGVVHGGNREGRFFVLSAVIAPDQLWQRINTRVLQIKSKHFPHISPNLLEIRMYDIWEGRKGYRGISISQRISFLSDIFSIFEEECLTVVSIVVLKKEWTEKYPNLGFEKIAWKNLLERIEMFLTSEGQYENGLIIMDAENSSEDEKIRQWVEAIRREGTNYVSMHHLIEDIFFTKSELRNLTQLADVAAYCTRQHMRQNPDIVDFWKLLELRLRRDSSGNYHGIGLKIIP